MKQQKPDDTALYRKLRGAFEMTPEQKKRVEQEIMRRAAAPKTVTVQTVQVDYADAETAERKLPGGYWFALRAIPLAACLVLVCAGAFFLHRGLKDPAEPVTQQSSLSVEEQVTLPATEQPETALTTVKMVYPDRRSTDRSADCSGTAEFGIRCREPDNCRTDNRDGSRDNGAGNCIGHRSCGSRHNDHCVCGKDDNVSNSNNKGDYSQGNNHQGDDDKGNNHQGDDDKGDDNKGDNHQGDNNKGNDNKDNDHQGDHYNSDHHSDRTAAVDAGC